MAPFVSHKGNFGLWRPPCAKGTFGPLPQRNPVLTAGSTRTPGYNLCGPRLGMEAGKGLGVSTPGCYQTHPLLLPDPSSSLPQVGPFPHLLPTPCAHLLGLSGVCKLVCRASCSSFMATVRQYSMMPFATARNG